MVDLLKRVAEFENDVENYLIDGAGLLRSALDINTMKPFPSGYFTADLDIIRSPGDAVVHWLWAFWQGRARGLW